MLATKKKTSLIKKKSVKKLTSFKVQVRSRHPSHSWLRHNIGLLPFRSIVRLGSTTQIGDEVSIGGRRIECNTIQSINTSASKLLMKQAFQKASVITAQWWTYNNLPAKREYPIVIKHINGSRGEGNFLAKDEQEFNKIMQGKTPSNYIFEKFYNYTREYRLHVTKDGCFYTCRKMLKETTPKDKRWFRNDSNSVWVLEENPQFDKPTNWGTIVSECVKALKAVGLDIGAIDLKVQSAKTEKGKIRDNPEFIVIETNSAPSFGDITRQKYLQEIPKILKSKYESKS